MKKFLHLYDTYALKIGISLLIILTALYPKLPSIHIIRTWVYIRLEDFFILAVTLIWLVQLLRRKVKISFWVSLPIFIFWFVGLISLINSLIYIGPNLTNFFPHIAALNYLRRIEYMILFFVALSSVRSIKDLRDYVIILAITTFGVVLYGLGQRYYLDLWTKFPDFFEKYSFCFPSFQTGNEEFAKGIPLCLPGGSRLTSTFGGHYDLAAYLALVTPILLTVSLGIKKLKWKILGFLLFLANLILLILTASRVSFMAYIIAVIFALTFYKKKLFIIPVILISVILLIFFSESTAKRLLATARISSVVTDMQGQLVGESTANLPEDLKKKISQDNVAVEEKKPVERLPEGSGFIGLPQQKGPVKTKVAVVKKVLTPDEERRLKLESGSIKISTISGSFLVRKALVYDISFTTRLQGEWPNAWKAFMRNTLLGSGYSTITLATDNDYFRALGETGALGLASFLFIFLILAITLKEIVPHVKSQLAKSFAFGLAGGTLGLMFNASLIDVFEASKVAENLWMLLGIGVGTLLLYKKHPVPYLIDLKKVFTSNIFIAIYIFLLVFITYFGSLGNFFVAGDFIKLHSAAASSTNDIINKFTNSQNSVYDPLVKTLIFFLYTVFAFQPEGYRVFILLLHSLGSLGVYFLAQKIFKKKLPAFLASLFFILSPFLAQNIFWLSTLSITLSSVLILFTLISFLIFRQNKFIAAYPLAVLFNILALLTHDLAVVAPLLLITLDILLFKSQKITRRLLIYSVFIILTIIYFIILNLTHASYSASPLNLTYLFIAGLSILAVWLLNKTSLLIAKNKKTLSLLILLTASLLLIIISYTQVKKKGHEWQQAGNFTKNMLSILRLEYENLPKTSNLYFVAAPVKYGDAWIYPEGMSDSTWFIYQDNNPGIHQTKTVEDAKNLILKNNTQNNYIFIFEKDGIIKSVN